MLTAEGLRIACRARDEPVTRETDIYLADTMGELGLFYRLAGIAFIGGSLVAKGGHNPFEAARLECAVLHGPDMSNCAGMAAALAAGGAAETVTGAEALAQAVSALLGRFDVAAGARGPPARASPRRVSAFSTAVLERLAPWLDRLAPVRDGAEPPRSLRA